MLGTGLYYPHIDIPDPTWLRSAILFWDEIRTIAPREIERPYLSKDTEICQKEGYLKPEVCEFHQDIIEELGKKIIELATNNEALEYLIKNLPESDPARQSLSATLQYGFEFDEVAAECGVNSAHLTHIHPEKVPGALLHYFRERSHFDHEGIEWLLVDSRFADAYMAALATSFSQKLNISPLTSQEPTHGLSFRFMFDEIEPPTSFGTTGALVSVIMRGLRVDPSVPVEKLIQFRRSRQDQYLDMAQQIKALRKVLVDPESGLEGQSLVARAEELYQQEVELSLRALKRELENQSIQTVWEGAYRALTVSVPSATALAYFTGLTGPALIGAGAAIAASDIGIRSWIAARKARSESPFSYLFDAQKDFGLPPFVDT